MSKTYTLNVKKMAQEISEGIYDTTSASFRITQDSGCYVEFEDLPSSLLSLSPNYGNFTAYVTAQGIACRCENFPLVSELDIENGVYPAKSDTQGSGYAYMNGSGWVNMSMVLPVRCAQDGMFLGAGEHPSFGNIPYLINTQNSSYLPYISLIYDEGKLTTLSNYPIGYINRQNSNEFSWRTTYEGFPIEDVDQTSATFQWKNGTNGQINSIQINGSNTTYVVPQNTFPSSDEIYWRVVAVTSLGTTDPEWAQIKTSDSISTSTAISPSGIYVDNTKSTKFVWKHNTDTGTEQTKFDLQIKASNGDWQTIKSEETNNEFCEVEEGILPSGTILWRVRTYNADMVAGEWSNELTIMVIGSPNAPSIQIDTISPRPKISWTSQEQQAYQVQMGDYDSKLQFGTAKTFKCPIYLQDGSTRLRVRVINEYNLWSDWAEIIINIQNQPKTSITLNVIGGREAQLTWNYNEVYKEYWIYRNGKRIAKTKGNSFVDRLSIGNNSYFVRETYEEDDNYTDSNIVNAIIKTDYPIICDLKGSNWISLKLSTNSVQSVQISEQQEITLAQYSGTVYPTPEIAPFKQKSYNISTAYMDQEKSKQFETLLGKIVCVKDQYNNIVIGIITSYTKICTTFYTTYSALVNEIDEVEYIEGD